MKRIFPVIACIGALSLAACTGDSALPDPTGKGAVRAINAIPGAPQIGFLIEERLITAVEYKNSTSPALYDDFDYTFNFEVAFPGDDENTRVASTPLKVEADRDHIFLLSGDLNAPTVTVWDGDIRTWEGSETVFEARFAHAGESLGMVDVYFDPAGTAAGTNPPAATLSFGEIVSPAEFTEGGYVITVTAAGDLNTVYFTSPDTSLQPRFSHVITLFDGDANDTGPIAIRSMTAVGNPLVFADVTFPPKIRFLHSAFTLQAVDIYDDEILTNLVASNLGFRGATADMDTSSDTKTYYFTPAGSTATTLFSQEITAPAYGTFSHVYMFGDTGAWSANRFHPDRATSLTSAKLRIFHGAVNHISFDTYIKDRGDPLVEEDGPTIFNTLYPAPAPTLPLIAGNYDLYLTVEGEKTVLAGPLQLDIAVGDLVDLMAVDTVDPNVIEIVNVPIP